MDSNLSKSFATASVTREAGRALIDAALAACKDIGIEAAVAVVDATGTLRAFERSDGCPFLAAEVALNKAWTAASYGYPTHVWNQYISDPAVGPLANLPKMMAVGGGYPLLDGGKLIGAIGISGGNVQQDQGAATAALKAVGFEVVG